jgi:hypothetical protein
MTFSSSPSTVSSSQTRGALDGGAGLSFGFGPTELFLESKYVYVFGDNGHASYVPVIIGLTFR